VEVTQLSLYLKVLAGQDWPTFARKCSLTGSNEHAQRLMLQYLVRLN
jgi:hypothetical protein